MNIHPKVGKMEDAIGQYKNLVRFAEHLGFGRPVQCSECSAEKDWATVFVTLYEMKDAKNNETLYAYILYGIRKTDNGLFPATSIQLRMRDLVRSLEYVTDRHEWMCSVRGKCTQAHQVVDASKIGGIVSDTIAEYRRQCQPENAVIVPARIIDIKA